MGLKDDIKKENKKLCDKFPFLIPRSVWDGSIIQDYDYEFTLLDSLPNGWMKKFGIQMCEELREILIKANYLDDYRVNDIKEKYGVLCWYDNGIPAEIESDYNDWLDKYTELSSKVCICCGEPATHVSKGWISYFCKDCVEKLNKDAEPIIPEDFA